MAIKRLILPIAPATTAYSTFSAAHPILRRRSCSRGALDACVAMRWMPWPAMLAFMALVGWLARGWQLAAFTAAALGYIVWPATGSRA